MHAYCLEWLHQKLKPGSKVLDVGCGSGYLTAAFYEMVKDDKSEGTRVVGIEHIDPLAIFALENLRKSYRSELDTSKIKVISGDGRLGYPQDSPYDVIHVGAAAPSVPKALVEQLAIGGILVIPVGTTN